MEGPGNFENTHPKKAFYEAKIWEKAEELSGLRIILIKESESIFAQVQSGNVGAIGLEAKEKVGQLQIKYFALLAQIEDLKKQESALEEALGRINNNDVDEDYLDNLLGIEKEKLSKRKQRIMEERAVTGVDPRSGTFVDSPYAVPVDTYTVKNFGPGSNRLTTGHHVKSLKGNLGSGSGNEIGLAIDFHKATQDSHGGKAHFGKRGSSYTNSEGKRVRKK